MAGRRTSLYPRHAATGARIVDFAGWEMPLQYRSVKEEEESVRTAAGLFDVGHMGRFEVRGPEAGAFLQGLVTNDLATLGPDRARYSLLCRPDGGILDDLVVYRWHDVWAVVVNAANREKDLTWLRDHAPAGVEVVDRSEEVALLALQGPDAQRLLPAPAVDLDAIPPFGLASGEVAGIPAGISRTGYTGEDGFELFLPAEQAAHVWDVLLEAGAVPCGLATRDVCRLEAGLRLYGSDMDEQTNPYEAGLGWTVKLQKGDFVGRTALQRAKEHPPARMLVGLTGGDRTIPRHGARVSSDDREIGRVTSGTFSFWLRAGIAMAYLDAGAADVGSRVAVSGRGHEGNVVVTALPFYRGSVRPAARPQA